MSTTRRPTAVLSAAALLLPLALGWAAWRATARVVPLPSAIGPTANASAPSGEFTPADHTAGRTAAATDLGCHGALAGSTFRYRITDTMTFVVHSAEGAAQPAGSLHLVGEVLTTVLDRRPSGILVQQQLHNLRLCDPAGQAIRGDAMADRWLAAAATPVSMHFGPLGTVLGYGFADGLDGDQRNFLRGTLGLFSIEAPAAAEVWQRVESDNTGEFAAEYRQLPAGSPTQRAVERRRLGYHTMVGQEPTPDHRLRGATCAQFATDLGWIAGVQADEGMTMSLPLADLQVVSSRRTEVVLLESGHTQLAVDVADAWQRTTVAVQSHEPAGTHAADLEVEHWRQQLQGANLDQLLAELQTLLGAQPVDDAAVNALFLKLQWLAKLDPAAIAALRDGVLAGTLPAGTAPTALSALAAAGTPAAQSALVAVRERRTLAAETRLAATIAAVQLDAPSNALLQSLWQDASGAVGAGAGGGGEVRGSSMLVLGVLSGRNHEPLADGRTATQALLAMEAEAVATGDLPTWLLAVGNTGTGEALPIADRYLEHVDATVRSSACVLLRRVPGNAAIERLATRALRDVASTVRGEAIRELGRRSEPAARAALEQVLANETDEELRGKVRELLARAR